MSYTLPVFTTLFVALRIWSRWKLAIGIGKDDYFIIAAWISCMINIAFGILITVNGFGRHTFYLETERVSNALKVRGTNVLNSGQE
jgi:hypothetical protein